ncbi:MAG TPA: PAS domain S-box protein [Gemmatimonadales bacterium]|nr:PAS domain S-box protein [Gemmatimonadales bacterium]
MEHDLPPLSQPELDRLRLVAVVESSDDAIVSKDLDGTIRSWNGAAVRIFGYTADEMIGGSIFRLIPPELHDEEHGLLARIRQGEHIGHYETERIRKDGRRIRISLTLSPIRDDAGRLLGASAIKRDVTRQRMLESQLHRAQRMEAVGRLAGGIAHDFNNLLTVIGGLTALSLRDATQPGKLRTSLEQVLVATDRATALVEQLLLFSRRQIAQVELLEIGEVVEKLQILLRPVIGEHITLRTRRGSGTGLVRASRVQVEQVLMNLALNARDAMPDGGTLTIETEDVEVDGHFLQEQLRLQPGSYVVVSVSDTGEGMDAVTQANIFEPFFTTKAPGSGTGLGLATVYAVVQEAGGAIYVYSEPGQGSVFKVYLPRATDANTAPVPATPDRGLEARGEERASGEVVLLVEDEPGVRAFSAEVLAEGGYRVLQAATGEEALAIAAARTEAIDMLLTDVVLPGINGRVLAERLHVARPSLPVLYMSGYTDDMVVRTGVLANSAAFLQKPFTPQGLLDRMRTILGTSKPRTSA